MNFVLNMAWREMRASWHRLLLFFLCIAVGVGSIVSLRSFAQTMKVSLRREARALFGADVMVGVTGPWKAETRALLERYSVSPLVTAHTEIVETLTMVRPADDALARPVLVQLSAVQERFPLYGEMRLEGGARYTHALLKERGVVATPGLLRLLNLKTGDAVKIGLLRFTIRGVTRSLPGSEMNFSPTPRVAVDYADVEAAGLIGLGSRVGSKWLFKTPEGKEGALLKELQRELRWTRLSGLGSFRSQQEFINTIFGRLEGFLGLIGPAILVLGGIGIASVTRVFVRQTLKTIAILKCLGGENRRVLGAYLAQVIALGLAGSLAGLLLAGVIALAGARYAAGLLPLDFKPGLTWQAALEGVSAGVLVAFLFSLPPLLEIRRVKPILVLRQAVPPRRRRIDWARLGARLLIAPGLAGLALWQSGSLVNAAIFLGGLAVTTVVLHLAGLALMSSLRRVRHLPSFVLRQGIAGLCRPDNQTRVILFTVGLGALFIIATRQHQLNAQSECALDLDSVAADMFLVDIPNDQRTAVEAAVTRLRGGELRLIPVVRARVAGVLRGPGNLNPAPEDVIRGRLGGEQRLSYRPNLEDDEKVVSGEFWGPTPAAEPEVSVEEEYGRWLGIGIGDRLIFDLPGRRIEARVTSIRRVERRIRPVSFLTRYNILFRPGVLEAAPQVFVGALKGPPPGERRARLQRVLVEEFLNVTVIDAFDTVAEVRKRLGELSLAVSFIGGAVLLCGLLILTGSIAITQFHRLYEAAILKTLGADMRLIVSITIVEYAVLGLLAGVIGSAAALGLNWAISNYGMNVTWRLEPSVNLIGAAATLLVVTVVGVLANWSVMVKKPLGILRAE